MQQILTIFSRLQALAVHAISCWHDNAVCLSVRPSVCDAVHCGRPIHPEQVNRKCPPRHTILQLSTPYAVPSSLNSPPLAPLTLVPPGE